MYNTKKIKNIQKVVSMIIIFTYITLFTLNVWAITNPANVTPTSTSAFDTIGQKIIGGIQAVGTLASVGVLIVLGIKYMMGSAEEKAEYKKTMIPYVVGCILVFFASNIAGMIYSFVGSTNNS